MHQDFKKILCTAQNIEGYRHTAEPYIDFEAACLPHSTGKPSDKTIYSVAQVTLVVEENAKPYAYFNYAISEPDGLKDVLPPHEHRAELDAAVKKMLDKFTLAGIEIDHVEDETLSAVSKTGVRK